MAIRPPSWCADAIPTARGWAHPRTGELLKAVRIKSHMIDEWHEFHAMENAEPATVAVEIQAALKSVLPAAEEPDLFVDITDVADQYDTAEGLPEIIVDGTVFPEEELEEEMMQDDMQMLNEAPANNKSLEEMTKLELEELGRQHGVELDRRKSKKTLVERMKSILD